MREVTIHDLQTVDGGTFLAFDLIDILRLAGAEVVASSWRCRWVESLGDLANELDGVGDAGTVVDGREMLRLAAGVYQVIEGDFEAYRAGEAAPWLVVRAVDSAFFEVSTGDEGLLARIRERFADVRDSTE